MEHRSRKKWGAGRCQCSQA